MALANCQYTDSNNSDEVVLCIMVYMCFGTEIWVNPYFILYYKGDETCERILGYCT